MKEMAYGYVNQTLIGDDFSKHVEEIYVRGFTVIPNLISSSDLATWRDKIDTIYNEQENNFGKDRLILLQELDTCRAPLLYDFDFIRLATIPLVFSLVKHFLGDWFILNLQNAIINRPNQLHHQHSWHRDLPYQNYVISRPLAINALVAIDDFSDDTGGTEILPFSHKMEVLPSDFYIERNRATTSASSGSVIVFDSMLFHRAGVNSSKIIRRAVNHLYTLPILKQQYDFPRALGMKDIAPDLLRFLGYTCQVPINDYEWREMRSERMMNQKTKVNLE